MQERIAPVSGPHSAPEDRQASRATAGTASRRQTPAGEPGQPEASTGNERPARSPGRRPAGPGPTRSPRPQGRGGDSGAEPAPRRTGCAGRKGTGSTRRPTRSQGKGSRIKVADAGTGSANHPGEGIEWARDAKRSPCTRRAADQKAPAEIDPRPTRRPSKARVRASPQQSRSPAERLPDEAKARTAVAAVRQLQALTDRQKERPERRSLRGEVFHRSPTAFRRVLTRMSGPLEYIDYQDHTTAGARG